MKNKNILLPIIIFISTIVIGLTAIIISENLKTQKVSLPSKAQEEKCTQSPQPGYPQPTCVPSDDGTVTEVQDLPCVGAGTCPNIYMRCTRTRRASGNDPLPNCGALSDWQCDTSVCKACPTEETPTQPERSTPTPTPSNTPAPSKTPVPSPTATGTPPSNTPIPSATKIPPTHTPIPTNTPILSNTPIPTFTPTPAPNACGYTQCDSAHPCNGGLTCVTAKNDKSYCAIPEYQDACKNNPSYDTCCRSTPNACGYTQCDSQHPCQNGLNCVTAKNDKSYCAKPENETACKNNPSMDSCCAGPTQAPTEIVIAKGGTTNTPVPPTIPSAGTPIQWIVVAAPLLLVALGLLF